MFGEYRGLAHEAAIIRIALTLGVKAYIARGYAEELYSLFNIEGQYSYEEIQRKMLECDDFPDIVGSLCIDKKEDFMEFVTEFMLVRGIERPNLIIKHHGVDSVILDDGQKATFIEYPLASWPDLKKDLKVAKHLKPLMKLDSEDIDKEVILLKVADKDTAFVSLNYIAAYIRSRYSKSDWYDITIDESMGEDPEFDFTKKMPIITLREIDDYFHNPQDNAVILFGNMESNVMNSKSNLPYYLERDKGPLCIMVNNNELNMYSLKNIEKLKGRSHIIIIVAPFRNQMTGLFGFGGQDNTVKIVTELEFTYAIEALVVETPNIGEGYYEAQLYDYAAELKCRFHSSIKTLELLSIIKKARNELTAQTIQRTILNAYRRGGKKPVLYMEDFAFLEAKHLTSTEKAKLPAREKFHKLIIGQEKAKKQILDALACNKMNIIRAEMGLPDSGMHNVFAFIGAPGTAKTTAAQIMGEIMMEEELLPGNRLISISGAQLKAQYLGQTAHRVREIFQGHDIIILDEIYGLTSGDFADPYAEEALAQICIELEESGKTKLICFLGYGGDVDASDNKMKTFIDANPGIASRISHIINFESYDPHNEMPKILEGLASNLGYTLSENSLQLATEFFAKRATSRDFGNGREARRLLQNAIKHQSVRIQEAKSYTRADLEQIIEDDIEPAINEILKSSVDLEGRSQKRIGF